MPSSLLRAGAVAALAVLTLTLAGCVETPTPTPTPTSTSGETAAPVDPEIDLEGSADDNRAYFDQVNADLIAAGGALDGRAFIDNLVAAGYPKADMEVTPDRTAINGAADNIQFSIRLNGTCLIGQYGNIGYASTTADLLSTGRCLVGTTRPIDW
ncbi:DUF6993 domain-containing protein [Pseudolysinimonas yzui]|uniref:DUF6993 domain-containing protein n=1 Tax=Pseudolysinimonas yzui TaxID=2708254 RepID=A0A8J3GQT0_9MICO|nr:hypothetical protein [Pseudolysinimonas yzui]GHF17406.1 hypothetical protein GCM10011600_17730 [Pseudolysinimonas yzui]